MTVYSPEDTTLENKWFCTSALLDMFPDIPQDKIIQASSRMVEAGMTRTHIKRVWDKYEDLRLDGALFMTELARHNAPIEYRVSFIEAPEFAASLSAKTKTDIISELKNSWSGAGAERGGEIVERTISLFSLAALAGIDTVFGITIAGMISSNPNLTTTAEILATGFPHFVSEMLASATGQALSAAGIVFAATSVTHLAGEIFNAKKREHRVSSINLQDKIRDPQRDGTLLGLLADPEKTRRAIKAIAKPYDSLLTHLGEPELLLFVHGNDDLRREMLTAHPPSYEQRLDCVFMLNKGAISRWAAQMRLSGTSWNSLIASTPVSLGSSLLAMRKKEQAAKVTTLSPNGMRISSPA
jgi:hypothetical protein